MLNLKQKASQFYHREKMKRFYSRFIKRGDLVFDIGANIGDRTRIFLALGSKVVAIEPQRECVNIIKKRYGKKNVSVIERVVGKKEGTAELLFCDNDILSSLSPEWIEKVKKSGRFNLNNWQASKEITMSTLDSLIKEFGVPHFCKIDVEGYEYEVLKGLTIPIKYISFEFTPEAREIAINCINYLKNMGEVRFNYSEGESLCLKFKKWLSADQMCDFLMEVPVSSGDLFNWGDVYSNFVEFACK